MTIEGKMTRDGKIKVSLVIGCLFVGIFVITAITIPELHKVNDRPYNPLHLTEHLKLEIKNETEYLPPYKIMIYAKDKTRKLLKFSTTCEPFDDRRITKMHCMGYAQVYATILNYAFKVNNIKGSAKPVVGYVYWNRINLNNISKILPVKWKNFTKDHDFVEVEYETNFKYYVDPLLDLVLKQ